MEMTAEVEVAAPQDHLLARVTDVETMERRAARRGIEVERLGPPEGREGPPGVGSAWRVALDAMGARREVLMRVAEMGPEGPRLAVEIAGVAGDVDVRVEPLGPERSRLALSGAFAARGLGGRLALGALGAMRGEIERRLQDRLDVFAGRVGAEWAAGGASAAG